MGKKSQLFHVMTGRWAWTFMVVLPTIWIVFICLGYTQDDYVEDSVYNIWSRSGGAYFQDKEYQEEAMGENKLSTSSFLAMAVTRDGGNLFTASRLEEVRARMEITENTTIEYKGETYDWQDLCYSNNAGLGTTYQFPCLRLSPMDLFQEARWFFDETDRVTWYNEVVRKLLVKPRIPRFGILQGLCSTAGGETSQSDACNEVLLLRTNQEYATLKGYPDDYANPLKLFSDIGDLELNDPCRICYDQGFESLMERLTTGTQAVFGIMAFELQRTLGLLQADNTTSPQDLQELGALLQNAAAIAQKVDRTAVEEFYTYYVTRALYAQLGAEAYAENYANVMASQLGQVCLGVTGGDLTKCAPNVNETEAIAALTRHADNVFSSVTTAGSPFPFWSNGDGTGALFGGSIPVSGSGIDLSGQLLTSAAYFNATHFNTPAWSPLYANGQYPDPLTPGANWAAFVETDPIFKWFMAGETPMTSHCGNGNLTGTATGDPTTDVSTGAAAAGLLTQRWCTKYNEPYLVDGEETVQHFAKMWYNLVIDSPSFLGITQGESDPYVWTTGQGCGYELKGMRDPYTNQTESDILQKASRELYYIDEGVSVGALDRNLLMGDVTPSVQEYNATNPLQHLGVIQTIYVTGTSRDIVERVKNCNRPRGPISITEEDAEEVFTLWKEAMEDSWTEDWNNDTAGEVQFVGFYDDQGGAPGTFSQLLGDITLDNGKLMAISIILIAFLSAIFLFSCNPIESRVLITLVGVALVILSFFAALGFGITVGIKININIAWTLPFIILGLGVDDMYIVILALKRRAGYSKRDFIAAMKDIVVPVSLTSLVNASMFAVMNITDIQAIYKTAQVALISVIFLYLTIIFCFPAYCYLDMRRQSAGRYDVLICKKKDPQDETMEGSAGNTEHRAKKARFLCCKKKKEENGDGDEEEGVGSAENGAKKTRFENIAARVPDDPSSILYEKVYFPCVLGDTWFPRLNRIFIWCASFALLGVGIWGITQRQLGLGVEEFFPSGHQAQVWAKTRTASLASWSVAVNWGALNYTDPDEQMRMIKQFEEIVATPHIAETDTKQLWMADLVVWTTRQCAENFDREDPDVKACGRDQIFPVDNTTCSGTWKENKLGLRQKFFDDPKSDQCYPFEGGICRPTDQMHFMDIIELGISPTSNKTWCPVFEGWSDEKLQFCVEQWRNITGGGGGLIVEKDTATPYEQCAGEFHNDDEVRVPILYSSSPTMFAYDLFSHDDTVEMIQETRDMCDRNENLHCWMTGIPFDYWEQYLWVENLLLEIGGIAIAVGFGVAWLFLFSQLFAEGQHGIAKILKASVVGALLIAMNCCLTLIPVVGLSTLFDVNWTAFGMMSFVLSVGFSVEYSCHIVHRWLSAPLRIDNAKARVEFCMSFLALPLTLSFISSTIGVACLAFTDFDFNKVYFFRPLIIVMFVSFFQGCWFLPVVLMNLNCDFLKVGKTVSNSVFNLGYEKDSAAAMEAAAAVAVDESGEIQMSDKPEAPMESKTDASGPIDPVVEGAEADEAT